VTIRNTRCHVRRSRVPVTEFYRTKLQNFRIVYTNETKLPRVEFFKQVGLRSLPIPPKIPVIYKDGRVSSKVVAARDSICVAWKASSRPEVADTRVLTAPSKGTKPDTTRGYYFKASSLEARAKGATDKEREHILINNPPPMRPEIRIVYKDCRNAIFTVQ